MERAPTQSVLAWREWREETRRCCADRALLAVTLCVCVCACACACVCVQVPGADVADLGRTQDQGAHLARTHDRARARALGGAACSGQPGLRCHGDGAALCLQSSCAAAVPCRRRSRQDPGGRRETRGPARWSACSRAALRAALRWWLGANPRRRRWCWWRRWLLLRLRLVTYPVWRIGCRIASCRVARSALHSVHLPVHPLTYAPAYPSYAPAPACLHARLRAESGGSRRELVLAQHWRSPFRSPSAPACLRTCFRARARAHVMRPRL